MAAKISEIDALKEIDKYFEQLTEDERQRIIDYVSSKYSLAVKSKATSVGGGSIPNGSGGNVQIDGNVTIKQFVTNKKPSGFYEQIACLGYYLEKIQGVESFGTKEISQANTDARITKLPNPSLYLKNCFAKYGYLVQVGGGKKALSARGEALVEALPDRESVKTALENNPIKKKGGPKKKKAKK